MPARTPPSPKKLSRSVASRTAKPAPAKSSKAAGKASAKAPQKRGALAKVSKVSKAAKAVAAPVKKAAKKVAAVAAAKPAARKAGKGTKVYDAAALKAVAKATDVWAKGELAKITAKAPLRRPGFITDSGVPIPDVLTAADRKAEDFERIGLPGQFPFTRGVQPSMYRGRLWTMRQFAGFGTPADTNKRFKYLISHGMTGLSTAFDMPALMGYDADHPMSRGEVGKEGVAISSLKDFEVLFDGIPLEKVSTSMTINASAVVALCMYIAVGEKQGVPMEKLAGTIQNDMLKEYIAQKEWIVSPRPAVRIVTDMIEFCTKNMPKWYPVSISGYHIREAGATAVQELAFTLADGIGYVEECVKRGLDVDSFAPQLSFFWDVHNDFFEEVAKFRAARRIWAHVMRDRFGAKNPRSMQLKTHAQTAGVSLTAQQPYNNVVRTALQAFAAVLGGTQSLHTNSLDETYALPTEESVTIALRTQQLIAHESGADRVVDPLAGSYYVEYLTDEMEKRALEYIRRIDEMGGIIRAVEEQYPQKEIGESAYRFQREVEQGDRLIVGVNAFKSEGSAPIELLHIDEKVAEEQIARLKQVKAERNNEAVNAALAKVEAAARGTENVVPAVLEAVKAYATLGEVCDVFRKVWGPYREGGAF
ncbi:MULTISPECIES: methylmalonyl-CoA mutase [Myxococcaceae]|uniref:acyl-CoA mutase large subunit family protein n=1 Tax=Myxococcaceae TaxID=31 RepID=UPI00188E3B32|nr:MULTISPECIES: methylmalonyl-CoA mutase family protein [Myxococcaceae]MBF5040858.1 methylmalonyl-CoA mutase family protein [Simulacricoccus sp. 17bor-14]